MKRISALFGAGVLAVAALAACGGGGGGSGTSAPGSALPPSGPTPTPGGSTSFSASNAVAIPTPAPGATAVPVPLPSDPSGASGTLSLPATANVPADATVAAVYSTVSDGTVPALGARRAAASVRSARDGDGRTVIAYLRLQFSADVTLAQAPAFTFVVPGALSTNGVAYWLAFIDPELQAAGWQLGFEGPALVTPAQTSSGKPGTQLAFASNGKPLTFAANQVYYFAVYAMATNAATPTPVPSSIPSNPPPETKPAPVAASPANVQFAALTDAPVAVTFSQAGFTGAFHIGGDCTGIVNTSGASPTWTLTPVGQGRCVIVGLGDKGASAVVHVGVVTPYETPHPKPSPTVAPTHEPTNAPTSAPTSAPSAEPSHSPEPTHAPTASPTTAPTHEPTSAPTSAPTSTPTWPPGSEPTHAPTAAPTVERSSQPAQSPAPGPTATPV